MTNGYPRAAKITTLVAVVAASSAFSATRATSAEPSEPEVGGIAHAEGHTAANRALVTYFYDQLFNQGNLSVIDRFVSPHYIQHNPTLPDGPEALRQLVITLRTNFPQTHNTIERIVAEDDLVLLHSNAVGIPGTKGRAIVDLFRVADGKIVEHWDIIEAAPDSTVSGNDMFSTLSQPPNDGPESFAPTWYHRQLVFAYFTRLTRDRDLAAIDRYLAPSYYQHDPTQPNGPEAVEVLFANIFETYPNFIVSSIRVIAEGDLVAIRYHYQTSPEDRGQAVADIFRVRGDEIVEHWNVVQAVPATSANTNTMF